MGSGMRAVEPPNKGHFGTIHFRGCLSSGGGGGGGGVRVNNVLALIIQ